MGNYNDCVSKAPGQPQTQNKCHIIYEDYWIERIILILYIQIYFLFLCLLKLNNK